MIIKSVKSIVLFLAVLLSVGSAQISFTEEIKSGDDTIYKEQPVHFHLTCSRIKLDESRINARNSGDQNRLAKLDEAAQWLETAIERFDYYRHPEYVVNTSPYEKVPPEPKLPDPNKSPLYLLDHLRFAYDDALQVSAQLMVQSVQYTESEVKRLEALDEAVDAMEKAIKAVEKSRGWLIHASPSYRVSIEAPPEYEVFESENMGALSIKALKEDGSAAKLIYIGIHKKEEGISPEEFLEQQISSKQKRFSDIHDIQREKTKGYDRDFRSWYTYKYNWEGELIQALIYIRGYAERAYTVNCVAPVEFFNRREFDEIIRTFRF